MDFKDKLKLLNERVLKLKDNILTEEATKNAFIMPFLQALGYDVFNPLEVVPEYITDIGTKKGEKIDYAILKDNQPIIIIECKHWSQNLDIHDGQILRYFHVSKARFGILTNGIQYRFYTDLIAPNIMDDKPFLEFDMIDIKESLIDELKKFHKEYFDLERILTTANELKYTNEINQILTKEFKSPSEAFVKLFVSQVYNGRATEKVLTMFTDLVKKSCHHVISEIITDRLKVALNKEHEEVNHKSSESIPIPLSDATIADEKKVETTVEEMEAYFVVKSILRQKIAVNRIAFRDAQSYFSILLDDNNRKPICRLYLDGTKKQLGLFNNDKKEIKNEISCLDDIYKFEQELLTSIDLYDNK